MSSRFITATESDDEALKKLLPKFTAASRSSLRMLLQSGFTGQIPAATVKELLASEGKDIGSIMIGLLPLARTYSRPPISNYYVGAVVRGASGSLYPGANLEIPGHSLGFSVHAEQAALSNAYMHSELGVSSIAVTAAPCGHCRQFMKEISRGSEIEILVEGKAPATLAELLPFAFGPADLGFKNGAFPVRESNLVLANAPDDLTRAALDAARHSYAPYSQSTSGVAIATKGGRIHRGSYLENAAFNPSLSPLQAALIQLVLAGEEFSKISRVVLVEDGAGNISQESVTRAALSSLAPTASVLRIAANQKS
jgi:cytidine deaminase